MKGGKMLEYGVIEEIKSGKLVIRMETEGAGGCEKCQMNGICIPNKSKRVLELTPSPDILSRAKPDMRVKIELGEGRSVFFSFLLFIVPLVLIIGSIFILSKLMHEMAATGIGIGIASLYFLLIKGLERVFLKRVKIELLP